MLPKKELMEIHKKNPKRGDIDCDRARSQWSTKFFHYKINKVCVCRRTPIDITSRRLWSCTITPQTPGRHNFFSEVSQFLFYSS